MPVLTNVDLAGFESRFLLCHGHALRAAVLEADFDGKHTGSRLLKHVHAAFLRGNNAQFGE
jgi:hypothetical protein